VEAGELVEKYQKYNRKTKKKNLSDKKKK